MPRYEYQCPKCEEKILVTRSIHDDEPEYKCEKCAEVMTQVIGGVTLSFKGTGWAGKAR